MSAKKEKKDAVLLQPEHAWEMSAGDQGWCVQSARTEEHTHGETDNKQLCTPDDQRCAKATPAPCQLHSQRVKPLQQPAADNGLAIQFKEKASTPDGACGNTAIMTNTCAG
jgi:hypothetical protein